MTAARIPSWRDALPPAWLFLMVVVYPIPHTIALRNLLLAGALIAMLMTARPWRANFLGLCAAARWAKPAGVVLAVLTAWMLLQSTFISPFPERALPLFGGQWPQLLVTAFLGLAMARRQPRAGLQAIVLALAVHIVILLIYQLYLAGTTPPLTGSRPLTPFAERDYHSLLNGCLFALLAGDRLAALSGTPPPLRLPERLVWVMLLASLVADVCLRTRNGTLVTVALVALFVAALAVAGRPRLRLRLAAAAVAAILVVGMTFRNDVRWEGFVESATIGLNSDSLHWASFDIEPPPTPSGHQLEESAYARAAWAKQAVEAIGRYPWGLGFGHQAFGWAVEIKYGIKGMESSHSGWLDFALANGLPGLALWLALSGWLIVAGWRRCRELGDGRGLLLAFSVLAYLLRCLVDGHLSGWRLAMYALLVGALVGAMSRPQEAA